MTAPVPSGPSPLPTLQKHASKVGSFSIDPNFLQNQTVKVYVRLKPSEDDNVEDKKKKPKNEKRGWNIQKAGAVDILVQKGTSRKVEGKTVFHFDQVFEEDAHNSLLYKSIARSMVHSVLNGKHATVLTYGQTGSGKTFTMQGDGNAKSGQAGIIQLVVADMFRFIRLGAQTKRDFTIKISYVEIYNERVRDLLSDDAGDTASQGTPKGTPPMVDDGGQEVEIRTSGKGEVTMNCVTRQVITMEEVLPLLIYGNSQRVVAKTDMNNHSSRSHAIFRLTVESSSKDLGPGAEVLRVADFNLVDLAGSESSNTTGKRQKEGGKGNQSLLSLSNIINTLSLPEKKRPKDISYRDSKLTRILQPHLQGNAEIAIVCCAPGSKVFVEETRSTLKFGSIAKLVAVNPKVNELNDDQALIKKLQAELADARREIDELKRNRVLDDSIIFESLNSTNSRPMNYAASASSMGDTTDDDDGSYGYEDMNAGPGHREFNFISNQEVPPPPQGPEEGENGPGMGGRAYVMPKNQDIPPEMQRDYDMPNDQETPQEMPREYTMPENPDVPEDTQIDYAIPTNQEIPLDLGREYGDLDSPTRTQRKYSIPKDQGAPADMDQSLKGRIDEGESDDYVADLHNSKAFHLDGVPQAQPKKELSRFLQVGASSGEMLDPESDGELSAVERLNSMNYKAHSVDFPLPGQGKNGSRHDQTGPTEAESLDIDGPEGSYAGVSMKFGSVMSTPDTLYGASTVAGRSKNGTLGSGGDGYLGQKANRVSWDTMDLNTMQPGQVGRPMKAIQSIYHRETPLPDEITILRVSAPEDHAQLCMSEKLQDAQSRVGFIQGRLELADDLVEGIFKDLERARLCIHDLVYRNAQLSAKLKQKKREDIKEDYQEGETVLEQYWLLKGSMYVGLFFFVTGGYEFFMAAIFMVWLILEINLGSVS